MSELVTAGESLALVSSSRVGGFDTDSAATVSFGGAESNVSIAAARLGTKTAWVGRVGNDALGRRILRGIRGEGVNVFTSVNSECPTALMVKDRPSPGRTRVVYYRQGSAGSTLAPTDVPNDLLACAKVFHFTGISLALNPLIAETVLAIARSARAHGVLVSFDFNFRSRLWSRESATAAYLEAVKLADIVFAGYDEANIAVGEGDSRQLAQRIAAYGPREVIIKLGAAGAYALADGTVFEHAALPVEVVDTVGAGDAFVGGYLSERIEGRDLQSCMQTASAAGACACRGEGDWEMMPTRQDIAELFSAIDPVSR